MLLAFGPDRPEGDLSDRLELSARLTAQGRLDEGVAVWRRMLPDARLVSGELVRTEAGWALRGKAGEDAPLWDFEAGVLRPGEYATLRPPGGEALVFRVVDVQPDQ